MPNIDPKHDDDKPTNEAGEEAGEKSTETIARAMTDDELRVMGLSSIGFLRKLFADEGLTDELEKALTTLERRVVNPHATSEEAVHAEPPTDRMTPPTSSRFAVRDDGVLLLSLEDADDRIIEGRTVIPFMVLTGDEGARARGVMDQALSDAAANVIGKLPMKAPTL